MLIQVYIYVYISYVYKQTNNQFCTHCVYQYKQTEYCFDSLHFHWGATNEFGSEHFIDNKSYPLEVHLVHYSCDFPIINPALTAYASGNLGKLYDDAHILAVIGVLFELGTEPNKVLDKILSDLIIDGVS